MINSEIIQLLQTKENLLKTFFAAQPPAFWEVQPEGKWAAGQHIIHLVQSTTPLLKALRLPNFILKWKFGTSNRPSRNYQDIIRKYEEKLTAAGPGVVGPFSRTKWASSVRRSAASPNPPSVKRRQRCASQNRCSSSNTALNHPNLRCVNCNDPRTVSC